MPAPILEFIAEDFGIIVKISERQTANATVYAVQIFDTDAEEYLPVIKFYPDFARAHEFAERCAAGK